MKKSIRNWLCYKGMRRSAVLSIMMAMTAVLLLIAILPSVSAALFVQNGKLRLTIAGGPVGNEKVEWAGTLAANPLISPGTQDVFFELSTDAAKFYSVQLPHGSLASNDGVFYKLTDAAKQQSGLEVFKMIRSADGSWDVSLKDAHATLQDLDYHSVCAKLTIGGETGEKCSTLAPVGTTWVGN